MTSEQIEVIAIMFASILIKKNSYISVEQATELAVRFYNEAVEHVNKK